MFAARSLSVVESAGEGRGERTHSVEARRLGGGAPNFVPVGLVAFDLEVSVAKRARKAD